MADLVITFSKAAKTQFGMVIPIESGDSTRTEAIAIGGSSIQSGYSAPFGESVVDILAGADCWVAIGANPTAEAVASSTDGNGTGTSRKLLSGERSQFSVTAGDKVAVIEA